MESDRLGRRLIGLDVGERRIGVAVSDERRVVALPECVIERRSVEEDVRALSDIARAKGGERFIVGLPLRLDGSRGVEADGVAQFACKLAERSGMAVEMSDERLSTKQAERHLIKGGVRRRRRREVVDKMAAQIILQSYIDAHQDMTREESE
jgi:putative Holliday junction resolvase